MLSIQIDELVSIQAPGSNSRQASATVIPPLVPVFDETQVLLDLFLGGCALWSADGSAYSGRRGRWPSLSTCGQCRGLLVGELAVEHAQRLRGHRGDVAHRTAGVGVGLVVVGKDRQQQRALDVDIDAPAARFFRRRRVQPEPGTRLARQDFLRIRRIDTGPPAFRFSRPLTVRIESRTSSASGGAC